MGALGIDPHHRDLGPALARGSPRGVAIGLFGTIEVNQGVGPPLGIEGQQPGGGSGPQRVAREMCGASLDPPHKARVRDPDRIPRGGDCEGLALGEWLPRDGHPLDRAVLGAADQEAF